MAVTRQRGRRHGQPVTVYLPRLEIDARGNRKWIADETSESITGTAWLVPGRSARAEVPGQQQVNVLTMGTALDLGPVGLWARVNWQNRWWDVVTPPRYHHGTRHVRHWTVDLRERP